MKIGHLYSQTALAGMAAVLLAAPGATLAQEQDAEGTETIIVTARKKAETLLDAPLAITAFDQVELQAAGFENVIDIAKATPGLFIEEFNQTPARVNTTPRFRGVFLSTDNRLQQTATVFIDGVYLSDGAETIGINELERVEIIKGPQSALFGRNTFAGAINYVTKDPGDELRADINLLAATRGEYRVSAGFEGPITETLGFRIGGMYESFDGHYDNTIVDGQRLGDEEQYSFNGTLSWKPTPAFRSKLRISYRKVNDGAPAAQETAGVNSHNFGGFLLNPDGTVDQSDSVVPPTIFDLNADVRTESVFRGVITQPDESTLGMNSGPDDIALFRSIIMNDSDFSDDIAIADFKYNFLNQDDWGLQLDSFRLGLNTELDISDSVSFTFLGGYNKENFGRWIDFDLTGDPSYLAYASREIEDFTLEGRFAGLLLNDRLEWQVGASYVDIEILQANGTASTFPFAFFGNIAFDDIFRTVPFRTQARTIGLFGSFDFEVTEKLSLTLEGRYQEDEVTEDEINEIRAAEGLDAVSPRTFTRFLPRVTLRYEPTELATVYFTYSKGNLPGGFNPEVAELDAVELAELQGLAPEADFAFEEEQLENFELGWKQQLWDGRAGFNLAAFYMRRSDEIVRQVLGIAENDPNASNPFRTVAFNSNGATTDIYGFELDLTVQVTENLTINGSAAYIDATIDSFPDEAGTGDFGDIFGPAADVSGQQAPRFPPFAGSLAGTWTQDITGGFIGFDNWFIRGDVFYTGNFWDSNANVTEVQDAFDTNLRVGLQGEDLRLELFVTNLFNENAPAAAFNFADLNIANRISNFPTSFFDFNREGAQVALRDKRQFGLRLTYTFR
ncbi:MAG: TonB-dependent receptor [Pseudomonadota bacterium]